MAAAANFALSLTDRTSSDASGIEFRLEDAPCLPEYSELAARIGSSLGICTVRSAEYLNWRYWQHPRVKHEFLAARRGTELLAYCTFTMVDGDVTIAELFGSMDYQVMRSLLQRLFSLLRDRGCNGEHASTGSRSRTGWLHRMGFWTREAAPVIVFGREATISGSQILLMHGDRES